MFLSSQLLAALDVVSLTMTVVNAGSGGSHRLADQIEEVLRTYPHLQVERHDDAVVARTDLGHAERVVLTGRLDLDARASEDESDELLARVEMGKLYGPGAGTLGGAAIMLKMAALGSYARDLTVVFGGSGDVPELDGATRTVRMRPTNATLEADGSYGPGDPAVAHTPGEFVPTAQLAECEHTVKGWLQA